MREDTKGAAVAVVERVAQAMRKSPGRVYMDDARAALAALKPGDDLSGGKFVVVRPSVTIVADEKGPIAIKLTNPAIRQAAERMRERCEVIEPDSDRSMESSKWHDGYATGIKDKNDAICALEIEE